MEMSIFQWNKLNNGPPPPPLLSPEMMRKWRAATGKKLILGEAIQSRFVYSIPAFPPPPAFSPPLQLIPSIHVQSCTRIFPFKLYAASIQIALKIYPRLASSSFFHDPVCTHVQYVCVCTFIGYPLFSGDRDRGSR